MLVDVEVSPEEAANGFSRRLNTPSGETVMVEKLGSVRDGQEIVYEGKGLPSFEGSGKGRLIISLRVRP